VVTVLNLMIIVHAAEHNAFRLVLSSVLSDCFSHCQLKFCNWL